MQLQIIKEKEKRLKSVSGINESSIDTWKRLERG